MVHKAAGSGNGKEIRVLRYWTNVGLLRHTRLENRHRVYAPEVADDVRFLRAAQQAGFSLNAIEHVLSCTLGNIRANHLGRHLRCWPSC
ncbi:MerR family transcriptional regulator [Deinococcus humi]|uniref:MerR family transcriptional regulator n=1 Tax=Deinococcus humi TaxID=662880 RepID=UPI001620843B